jgi:O-antigen ligase
MELFMPHDPITYPDGSQDKFNALRPLVGYGPESMYVAYNGFYPPELGHVESRTASPDRSHNETLDSLVITGVLGLVAYLFLFGAVFYWGFRWLGLLSTRRQFWIYVGLSFAVFSSRWRFRWAF